MVGTFMRAKDFTELERFQRFGRSTQSDLPGLGQIRSFPSRSECIYAPNILRFIMPQDKIVAVLGADAKIDRAGRVPTVFHFRNFKGVAAQGKPEWTFIGSITGIALDAHIAHRCLP
jgi:hypothetical protein